MNYWFTSDYHLGHANIIKYCGRPWKCERDMTEAIIKNHNARVAPEDIVFHDGDFCFRNSPGGKQGEGTVLKAVDYIRRLNGNFYFIKGNHDKNNSLKTIVEKLVIGHGKKRICIVHNPVHADPAYAINFVGHIHEKWQIRRLSENSVMVNIGCDVWDFKPVSFEEIMKRLRKWEKNEAKEKITKT